jgi:hypothetical protein
MREHDITMTMSSVIVPPSGEGILGRSNLQALRSHHPGRPSGFNVKRILGKGDLWITEYTIAFQRRSANTVSIIEYRNGKVERETQILRILSSRRPRGANRFNGSRDAALFPV